MVSTLPLACHIVDIRSIPVIASVLPICANRSRRTPINPFAVFHTRHTSRSRTPPKIRVPGLSFNRRFKMSDGSVETHPFTDNPNIVDGSDAKNLSRMRCVAYLLSCSTSCHPEQIFILIVEGPSPDLLQVFKVRSASLTMSL